MDEWGKFRETCSMTMNVSLDTAIRCLILNSREGRAAQSLNKTDDCLGPGLKSLFARINKRDLQACKEEKDSPIGRDGFT